MRFAADVFLPLRKPLLLHYRYPLIKQFTWRGSIPHGFQGKTMAQAPLVTLLLLIKMILAGMVVMSIIVKC